MRNIRPGVPADLAEVERVVRAAYTVYVERIGAPPGPMLDDYTARLREGAVWVVEAGVAIAALVVLLAREDHLLIDNIAVAPEHQGQGLGRLLMEFAEAEARARGLPALRLYTHQLMHENIALYARTGWTEIGRYRQDGFDRVFFRKPA